MSDFPSATLALAHTLLLTQELCFGLAGPFWARGKRDRNSWVVCLEPIANIAMRPAVLGGGSLRRRSGPQRQWL